MSTVTAVHDPARRLVHRRRLMKPAQVAEQFCVTLRTLGRWRARGTGPRFVRLANGHVRYDQAQVDAEIDAHVVARIAVPVWKPPECIDRASVERQEHALDKDGRCVFCDRAGLTASA